MSFNSRASRDYHQRQHAQTIKICGVIYGKQTNGKWNCHNCHRSFAMVSTLDKHVRKYHSVLAEESSSATSTANSENDSDSEEELSESHIFIKEIDSDIVFENPLASYHIYVNTRHNFVSCSLCGDQTTLKQTLSHIRKGCNSPRALTANATSAIKRQVAELQQMTGNQPLDEPNEIGGDIRPIEGIRIIRGLKCRVCSYASPSKETMNKHRRNIGHADFVPSFIQLVTRGITRKYVAVSHRSAVGAISANTNIASHFAETKISMREQWGRFETNAEGQVALGGPALEHIMKYEAKLSSNARRNWSWLLKVSEETDEAEDCQELLFMRDILYNLYEEIERLQNKTGSNILRFIMAPGQTNTHKYFTPLQKSRKRYAETLWSYCVFVLRVAVDQSIGNGIFAFPDEISLQPIDDLRNSLAQRNREEAKRNMWILLKNHFLFCFDYEFDYWKHPVMKWFLLRSSNHGHYTGFLTSDKMSSTIAQMLYSIRGCVLYFLQSHLQGNFSISDLVEMKYVNENESCPFAALKEQYNFLSRLAWLEYCPARIVQDLHYPRSLTIDGKFVSIELMERAIRSILARITETFRSLVFGRRFQEIQPPKLESICDDARSLEVGCWFGRHLIQTQAPYTEFLCDIIENNAQLKQRFFVNEQIQESEVRSIFYEADKAREYLLIAYHLLSGLPARASEISVLKLRNTNTELRNLYVNGGRMYTISRYSKNQSRTQRDSFIARFLPKQLANFFILELLIIRPMLINLALKIGDEATKNALMTYLFPFGEGAISPERIRRRFAQILRQECSLELSFGEYRHVAEHWSRTLLPQCPSQLASYYPYQAGHSLETSVLRYAIEENSPLGGAQQDINIQLFVSTEWHRLFNFNDEPMTSNTATPAVSHTEQLTLNPSSPVPRLEVHTLVPPRRFEYDSTMHKPNIFENSLGVTPAAMERALSGLRQMNHCVSNFWSIEQAQLVTSSLAAEQDVVGVIPTGGGKSAAFLIPSILKDGVTIVVFPLNVLVHQVFEKARDLRIPVKVFNPEASAEENTASLIIASVEVCDSASFVTFLLKTKIKRIIIDEAHLCISWSTWREKLKNLKTIRICDAPVILLTATIPIRYSKNIEKFFQFEPCWIRASSNRENLRYSVRKFVRHEDMKEEIRNTIVRFSETQNQNARWIIYCSTINKVLDTKAYLEETTDVNMLTYHASMDNDARRSVLRRWENGMSKGVIATTAFGLGVDYGEVRLVLVIGGSSFLDLVQEFGRAGRDGKESECILLFTNSDLEENQRLILPNDDTTRIDQDVQLAQNDFQALRTYSENVRVCRRWFITEYLDGANKAMLCKALKRNIACDICESATNSEDQELMLPLAATPLEIQVGRIRAVEQRTRILEDASSLKSLLERVKGHCLICLVSRHAWIKHTSTSRCTTYRRHCLRCFSGQHSLSHCRIGRHPSTGFCVKCYLPSEAGETQYHDPGYFGSTCNNGFGDILRDIAWLLYHKQAELIAEYFRQKNLGRKPGEQDFDTWVGLSSQRRGISNAAALFLFFMQEKMKPGNG